MDILELAPKLRPHLVPGTRLYFLVLAPFSLFFAKQNN
jgi:hypothetical protein